MNSVFGGGRRWQEKEDRLKSVRKSFSNQVFNAVLHTVDSVDFLIDERKKTDFEIS